MSELYFYNDLYCQISFEGSRLDCSKLRELFSDFEYEEQTYDLNHDGEIDWSVFSIEMHEFEEPILYFIDKCISHLNRLELIVSEYGIEKIIPVFSIYHWKSTGFSILPSTSEVLFKYNVEIHFDMYPSDKKRFIDKMRAEKKNKTK